MPESTVASPLIERDDELSRIAETLDRVSESGHHTTLLVHGDAGIGKTSLLREAARRAEQSGMQV
ncbi:MAG: ATP-binding protein, partial [Gaiellales bacterium]